MPSMSNLSVSLRRCSGDVVILDLVGFVDRHTVHTLDRTISQLTEQGHKQLVVNCTELGYLSSAGIGVLISHLLRLHKIGGNIRFYGVNRHIRTLLNVGGFSKVLTLVDSEREAVDGYLAARAPTEPLNLASVEVPSLKLEARAVDDSIVCLHLAGELDRHSIGALEQTLTQFIESGRAAIIVDFDEVSFCSSSGMGVFIQYVHKARLKDGDIRLCRMRDSSLTVLTMLGLQNIFQVFQTEEEAIASYKT